MGATDSSNSTDSERSTESIPSTESGVSAVTKTTSYESEPTSHVDAQSGKDGQQISSTQDRAQSTAIAENTETQDGTADAVAEDSRPKEADEGNNAESFDENASVSSASEDTEDEESMAEFDFCSDLARDITSTKGPKDITTAKGKSRIRNRQTLSYFLQVEARIKGLEKELTVLKKRTARASDTEVATKNSKDDSTPGGDIDAADGETIQQTENNIDDDRTPSKDRWSLKVAWKFFPDFVPNQYNERELPESVIDVLCEPVPTTLARNAKRKPRHGSKKSDGRPQRDIHQVRINSPYIGDAFTLAARKMSLEGYTDNKTQVPLAEESHIRPFKAFVEYDGQLRQVLSDLNEAASAPVEIPGPETAQPAELAAEEQNIDAKSVDEQQDDPLDDAERRKGL